jgi:hypothetical protein
MELLFSNDPGDSSQEKQEFLSRVNFDADMVCLTDLWKEAGSPSTKRPIDWFKIDSTEQLLETLGTMVQSGSKPLWVTRRGGISPGTYAHKSIALAYAKYLDARLHVLVNEVFFQRIEEEKNPDLIIDRAISTYKKKGKSDDWITKRLKGKARRNEFTSCLAEHGVDKDGFRNCTNAIYTPLWGGTTAVIREKKGLPDKANIRDNMSETELMAVEFAEHLSKETIEREKMNGNAKCELACTRSSKIVANALVQHNKKL